LNIESLYDLVIFELSKRIESKNGLSVFARKRSKFECWVKVELIDILVSSNISAFPEVDRVDVCFDNIGIELKTINTSINYPNTIKATKPITNNVNGVISDIEKLKTKSLKYKFVLFIVFPIKHDNVKWNIHLNRITRNLTEFRHLEFEFKENISGVIYLGEV